VGTIVNGSSREVDVGPTFHKRQPKLACTARAPEVASDEVTCAPVTGKLKLGRVVSGIFEAPANTEKSALSANCANNSDGRKITEKAQQVSDTSDYHDMVNLLTCTATEFILFVAVLTRMHKAENLAGKSDVTYKEMFARELVR
jgi:hypothetical protein